MSKDVKKHISAIHLAREAFRKVDNSERLKRLLKGRIHPNHDQILEPGDFVSFKEIDKNKWSGPGKVLGLDGKVILIKYGNMLRRVHSSRVIKHGEEFVPNKNGSNKEINHNKEADHKDSDC